MVYRNDDMGAFGGGIVVNFDNPKGYIITKAEFQCGCFYRVVNNPVFPLKFMPTREDTKKFSNNNLCYLRVYDENGLRKTCRRTMNIPAQNEVITFNG